MTLSQAVLLAILQGVTELFPISSLGHAVILLPLLGWSIGQRWPGFLPFLVVLHLGTVAAQMTYFWRDWIDVFRAVIGRGPVETRRRERRLPMLIVVATVPAVAFGFAFNRFFRDLFGTPTIAALFLLINGGILFFGERRRQTTATRRLDALSWGGALRIGIWQCSALIPGISRSGAAMVGGLLAGLCHEEAARFSFLLSPPIIVGAAALEIPKALRSGSQGIDPWVLIAGAATGITAYISIALLMHYFRRHEVQALDPFAYYCWAAGATALVALVVL
jgi:undecaprenyl-diphosphatase